LRRSAPRPALAGSASHDHERRESGAALVERLGTLCDALVDATATLSIDSLSL
jgi:hypothetical protein